MHTPGLASNQLRNEYQDYFAERYRRHGADVRTLWGSEASQLSRFRTLCEVGDLRNAAILDVGCGFGDLFGFLTRSEVPLADYLGLDCVDSILSEARRRYPQARFEARDVLEMEGEADFDFVFGSGIFFLDSPDWRNHLVRMTRAMLRHARRGVAVNFLSRHSSNRDGSSFYADPAETLGILMQDVTITAALRHTYRSNDFTVFLYRDWQNF